MTRQICLVAGATGALGEAVALGLAKTGAMLVLAGRDMARTQAVRAKIVKAMNNANVDVLQVDLSSQASIRKMAQVVTEKYLNLNVLMHTAAIFTGRRTLTVDGLEMMFATNHLAPFLLTELLLDLLKAGDSARIITVTAPSTSALDFADLQGETHFSALGAFGASKMANLLFTYALARRLEGTGVTANAVHPGLVKSNLMQQAVLPVRLLTPLLSGSAEKGVETPLYLATAAAVTSENGKFWKDRKPIASNAYAHDIQVQERLWDASTAITARSL